MPDHPLTLDGESVQAILAGAKSQHRMVMKPQPAEDCRKLAGPEWYAPKVLDREGDDAPGKPIWGVYDADGGEFGCRVRYALGDRLWVRETWNLFACSQDGDESWPSQSIPKGDPRINSIRIREVVDFPVAGMDGPHGGQGPWRSPVTMPRWASRLTLVVDEVRVELVGEIAPEDCDAEGIMRAENSTLTREDVFSHCWNIRHRAPYRFEDNPWCVALRFTARRCNIDEMGEADTEADA